MPSDFAAFILTHGRPDRVYTETTLRSHGYTGPIYLVCDDGDPSLGAYRDRFGAERVLVFSKEAVARTFDEGDNSGDRRSIVYARNACWQFAADLGLREFIQLDDDYSFFEFRFDGAGRYGYWPVRDLDALFRDLVAFLRVTPFLSVAISQGGDHIGGGAARTEIGTKRKAMNTFVCQTARPFQFVGRINEDVNTYTGLQRRGGAFLTIMAAKVVQKVSQTNAGGMTDLYLDGGTYVKSFYSVMYAPSSVRVADLSDRQKTRTIEDGRRGGRIHHRVNWNRTAPKILREALRKPLPG